MSPRAATIVTGASNRVPIVMGYPSGRASGTQEACAACGSARGGRTAQRSDGVLMELCDDTIACRTRWNEECER